MDTKIHILVFTFIANLTHVMVMLFDLPINTSLLLIQFFTERTCWLQLQVHMLWLHHNTDG